MWPVQTYRYYTGNISGSLNSMAGIDGYSEHDLQADLDELFYEEDIFTKVSLWKLHQTSLHCYIYQKITHCFHAENGDISPIDSTHKANAITASRCSGTSSDSSGPFTNMSRSVCSMILRYYDTIGTSVVICQPFIDMYGNTALETTRLIRICILISILSITSCLLKFSSRLQVLRKLQHSTMASKWLCISILL